jgi:hypothetical protein
MFLLEYSKQDKISVYKAILDRTYPTSETMLKPVNIVLSSILGDQCNKRVMEFNNYNNPEASHGSTRFVFSQVKAVWIAISNRC